MSASHYERSTHNEFGGRGGVIAFGTSIRKILFNDERFEGLQKLFNDES